MKPIVPVFLLALIAAVGGAVSFVNGRALTYEASADATVPLVAPSPSSTVIHSQLQPSLDIGDVTPARVLPRISGCLVSSRGCRCVDRDGHTLSDVPQDRCLAIANGQ